MNTRQSMGILGLGLAILAPSCKEPTAAVTHERTALISMCMVMNSMVEAAPGISVTNWSQLQGRFNFAHYDKLSISRPGSFPLQRHYVFLPNPTLMLPPSKGRVLLIRHQPVKDRDGHNGRGIISVGTNGYIYTWMWEAEVQVMLRQASTILPEPDLRAAQAITDEAYRAAADGRSHELDMHAEAFKLAARTLPEQFREWLANPRERSLSPFAITAALLLAALVAVFLRCCYLVWRGRRGRTP